MIVEIPILKTLTSVPAFARVRPTLCCITGLIDLLNLIEYSL